MNTYVKWVLAAFVAVIALSQPARAQYTWTVTKPVKNGTYPVGQIDLDIKVSWITNMSTAVVGFDYEVWINGVNRGGTTNNIMSTSGSSGGASWYKESGSIAVTTQYPNSKATLKIFGRSGTGRIGGCSTSVDIQLKP